MADVPNLMVTRDTDGVMVELYESYDRNCNDGLYR